MTQRIESSVRAAVEHALTVIVTTRIGPHETALTEDGEFTAEPTAEGVVAQTVVDLSRGDIFHSFDPAFVSGDGAALRSFHERAVSEAMTLASVRLTLVREVAALLGRDPAELLAAPQSKRP